MSETDNFVQKAKKIHGDKYDYSQAEYVNADTKLKIICPKHGPFEQTPYSHLNLKRNCPKCAFELNSIRKIQKYASEFAQKAKKVHGDKYDYSQTVYYGANAKKIKIICPKHGPFEQMPNDHLNGHGCPKCAHTKKQKPLKQKLIRNTEWFVQKAIQVHNDKYDYSLINYINSKTKVKIICPKHGPFEQTPSKHLKGAGCKHCANIKNAQKNSLDLKIFIQKAIQVHNNKYDYSQSVYSNYETPMSINCPIHGRFLQTPDSHLAGHECPKCNHSTSKTEKSILNFIKSIYNGTVIENDRTLLDGKEVDIYIPDKKVAIEFNGLFWHSELFVDKNYHKIKSKMAFEKGVRLIHIFEDQWSYKQNVCKSILSASLGVFQKKIPARKCVCKEISKELYNQFVSNNHIQGAEPHSPKIKIGLFFQNELVQCVGFGVSNSNSKEMELTRMTSKMFTQIIGGFSKLIAFSNLHSFISYVDLSLFNASGYAKVGFQILTELPPSYSYIDNNSKNRIRYHRRNFQKKFLARKFTDFKNTDTEHQCCLRNNFARVYDAGKLKVKFESKV